MKYRCRATPFPNKLSWCFFPKQRWISSHFFSFKSKSISQSECDHLLHLEAHNSVTKFHQSGSQAFSKMEPCSIIEIECPVPFIHQHVASHIIQFSDPTTKYLPNLIKLASTITKDNGKVADFQRPILPTHNLQSKVQYLTLQRKWFALNVMVPANTSVSSKTSYIQSMPSKRSDPPPTPLQSKMTAPIISHSTSKLN